MIKQMCCIFEAVEEEECWRQYEALHAGSERMNSVGITDADRAAADFRGNRTKLMELSAPKRDRRAHMDDVEEVRPCVYSGRDDQQSSSSTFWLRRFDAVESADPDRFYSLTKTYDNKPGTRAVEST